MIKTSISYIIAIFLVAAFSACKTSKPVAEETSRQVVLTEPLRIKADVIKLDSSMIKAAEAQKAIDTLYLTIRKTPCYGQCPIYTADIYNSGFVVYEGERFVENVGSYTGRLSPDALKSIRHLARTVNYFGFEDEYDSPVTDFPTTYTTMHFNGQRKTIKNRVGGPDELKEFENHVHKVLDGVTWTKKGGSEE